MLLIEPDVNDTDKKLKPIRPSQIYPSSIPMLSNTSSQSEISVHLKAFFFPDEMSSTAHLNVIEKLMSNGFSRFEVEDKYIFPLHERPHMSEVCHSYTIPVIDLKDLDGPHRTKVVNEIRQACEVDGFFQIVNHGVPETVMKSMMGTAKEFFEMPVEDRACLYSEDPRQVVRISTSFNITKDRFFDWRDYLTHPCHPLEEFIYSWPNKPAAYREVAGKYAKEIRALVLRLLSVIFEALGQDSDYLSTLFGKHSQVMNINYYPACPDPDLTFGVAPHSDPRGITILMQGDVVSNGRFKSAEHRAVTNTTTARISIPTFYGPSLDTFIAPAESMVDEEHPALYKGYKF